MVLLFSIAVVVIASCSFLFHGTCSAWHGVAGLLFALGATWRRGETREWVKQVVWFLVLLLVVALVGGVGMVESELVDSMGYHLPATRLLMLGWNPIEQGTWESIQSTFGLAQEDARAWMILSMPKGVWYFNAVMGHLIGNPLNLQFPLVPLLLVSVCVTVWRRTTWQPVIKALSLCLLVTQLPSANVDAVVFLAGVGLLASLCASVRQDRWPVVELVGYSFWMCVAKQTAMLHCAVFWMVFAGFRFCSQTRWQSCKRLFLLGSVLALLVGVVCISPYYTSWKNFGHPLYPKCTADAERYPVVDVTGDFREQNVDAAAMGHLGTYVNAFVSTAATRWYYNLKLGRQDFNPHAELWTSAQDDKIFYCEDSPTVWFVRLIFSLSILALLIFGGIPERLLAAMITLGTMALPTEMIGYIRYTPWYLWGSIWILAVLVSRWSSRRWISRMAWGLLVVGILVLVGGKLMPITVRIDQSFAARQLLRQTPPQIVFAGRADEIGQKQVLGQPLERDTLANAKLLQRQIPTLAASLVISCGDAVPGEDDPMQWSSFYDGSFKVSPECDLKRFSAFRQLIARPNRRDRLLGWPVFALKTWFITLPKLIAQHVTEGFSGGVK